MPKLQIITDAQSTISINGRIVGQIEPNTFSTFILPIGNHTICVDCCYSQLLSIKRDVFVEVDSLIEFNFSELIKEQPDLLKSLELFPFRQDGKLGFFEPITRSTIVPAFYDNGHAAFDKNGFCKVYISGRCGIINKKGGVIIPCLYNRIQCYNNGFMVQGSGLFGMLDISGAQIMEKVPYELKVCSQDGYFRGCYYSDSSNSYFMNEKGSLIISGEIDYYSADEFFVYAYKENKTAVYIKDGRQIIGFVYDHIWKRDNLFEVTYRESNTGEAKSGVIDFDGRAVVPVIYRRVSCLGGGFISVSNESENKTYKYDGKAISELPYQFEHIIAQNYVIFSDGDYQVLYDLSTNSSFRIKCDNISDFGGREGGALDEYGYLQITSNRKVGLIGPAPEHRLICECQYDYIFAFVNGYACVQKGKYFGAIDRTGKEVIPCIYGGEFFFSKDGYANVFNPWKMNTGYVIANDVIDTNNRSVLGKNNYYRVYWHHEHTRNTHPLIWAQVNRNSTYMIDFNGRVVGQYDIIDYPFNSEDGSYVVVNSVNGIDRKGWINRDGEEMIPCIYDCIKQAGKQSLWCEYKGKNALFNYNGDKLTGFVYTDVKEFHHGYAIAKRTTGYGILSEDGREVTEFIYSSIHSYIHRSQFDEFDIEDGPEDEDGPFRYGVGFVFRDDDLDHSGFINTKGERIVLRELGEKIIDNRGDQTL